jgi:hypothetical protein
MSNTSTTRGDSHLGHIPRLAACLAAVSLTTLAVGAAPAAADDPVVVSHLGCQLFEDGHTTVPAGRDIQLRLLGFEEGNYGLIRALLGAATATLTITTDQGVTTIDETSSLVVTPDPPRDWIARPPNYDLGVLAPGSTVTAYFTLTFRHPLAVLYPPVGPTGENGPFLTDQEDPVTCVITADSRG